jgi:SAM-dependent methyltransferase
MNILSNTDGALAAYEALADDYDAFTDGYEHEAWFEAIHSRAQQFGIPGDRALDVGCGTGKSAEQLIRSGFETQGCDISPAMIEVAQRRLPGHASEFFVADMRDLPEVGCFDFILCLDDALNYVLATDELVSSFRGMARSLSRQGILAFDVNTLATYRSAFSETMVRRTEDRFFVWQGKTDPAITAGGTAIAELDVFCTSDDHSWDRRSSVHVQRHYPRAAVLDALSEAGLECCAIDGQVGGATLQPNPDEDQHIKFVFFARMRM